MSVRRLLPLSLLLLASALPVQAGDGWSTVAYPLAGPPEVIGSYAAGCIAGAVPLPLVGDGYQVMRPSRNRYYGHPLLIRFVERLGQQTATQGGRLLIGDLGQPRGGPTPSGHRSHQSGLDVDVWFLQQPRERTLSRADTEQIEMPSMIRATEGTLNQSRWSPGYRDALKLAAQAPEVDRIFVNGIIKQALCESETDRRWLEKVRPWWGHDAHFHVRLACPPGSGQCKPQKPLPFGDGCDPDLRNWVRDLVQAARSPKPYRKPEPPSADRLPAACDAVLYNPTAWKAP
ncbi:MAG: penicillin-insensitive murein endopeptidase [Candidatus Contendobacter sp.]|jgi:penicillin-insensitive murein endopeptidase|nr:penicillin-insensitive murein endopeptidase [Gammaproteobacteria bacterium]MCC8993266.1 penicillin-insensitive murein endopeptidase [Candidatus Contendobacter sp.]